MPPKPNSRVVPFSWRSFWRESLSIVIASLENRRREHREISSIARHIGADYAGRFLIELLQNASDQASKAGKRESRVVVLRTQDCIAVSNEGAPFDAIGVDAVTSLGLSPKDPQFDIGNKGVGFKSVFQVSDAPEIYSAPDFDSSFIAGGGIRLRLDQNPFEGEAGKTLLQSLTAELLADAQRVENIRRHFHEEDVHAFVRAEARQAAPFKFPLPITESESRSRYAELEIPHAMQRAQTLIVLPLATDRLRRQAAEKAMSELLDGGGAVAAPLILFLPSVAEIEIHDRVRGERWVLRRPRTSFPTRTARGARLGEARTVRQQLEPVASKTETKWVIATRTLGDENDSDRSRAATERAAIQRTAGGLGVGWTSVQHANVTVALPRSSPGHPATLGVGGRLCIALPTEYPTGSPFWLDGRFHGKLDRKHIEFPEGGYNELLLRESHALVRDVIGDLRASASREDRRLAVLALEHADGAIGSYVGSAGGPADEACVLDAGGHAWLNPGEVLLPTREERALLGWARAAGVDPAAFGVHTPDAVLVDFAWDVLAQLCPSQSKRTGVDERFAERNQHAGGEALLETCARANRRAGKRFWEPFLSTLLGLPPTLVEGLRILPVRGGVLARPDEKVFFVPVPAKSAEDDAGEVDEIPDLVQRELRFFDEADTIPVRATARNFTPLAKKLAESLVQGPQRDRLLREALFPRLVDLASDHAKRDAALRLFHQAAEWLVEGGDQLAGRVTSVIRQLPLPVGSANGSWSWATSGQLYFGEGWCAPERAALLDAAYGHVPERRLLSWPEFEAGLRQAGISRRERDWWRDVMRRMGVSERPIVLQPNESQAAEAVFEKYGAAMFVRKVPCPLPQAAPYWDSYLSTLAARMSPVRACRTYSLEAVLWVDGLERVEARPAILRMLLEDDASYRTRIHTRVLRDDGRGALSDCLSLWMWVLATEHWNIIPSQLGEVEAARAWLPDAGESEERFQLLPRVSWAFRDSEILRRLNVTTLAATAASPAMPVTRLTNALFELAAKLPSLGGDERRSARLLAVELWGYLQTRCDAEPGVDLSHLLTQPVPLLRGDEPVPIRLSDIQNLLVDNEPARGMLLADRRTLIGLPVPGRPNVRALASKLNGLRHPDFVYWSSGVKIEHGFESQATPMPLVAFAEQNFPGVSRLMGAVLAYGAPRNIAPPSGEIFKAEWIRLQNTMLQRGLFAADFGRRLFVERAGTDQQLVLADGGLSPVHLLREARLLVSSDRAFAWQQLTELVDRRANPDLFYAELHISETEQHELEKALARMGTSGVEPLRAFALACWRVANPDEPLATFGAKWKEKVRDAGSLAAWLSLPDLADAWPTSEVMEDDARVRELLRAFAVSAEQWQDAMKELNLSPWRSPSGVRAFERARARVAAAVCASAAQRHRGGRSAVHVLTEKIRSLPPDPSIVGAPFDEFATDLSVLRAARALVRSMSPVIEYLDAELSDAIEGGSAVSSLVLGGTKRETETFASAEPATREIGASNTVKTVLSVAGAVASKLGETLDVAAVMAADEVKLFTSGWWANAYSVLRALHDEIASRAPETVKVLSDAKTFHELPPDPSSLWARFPMLGPYPAAEAPMPPKRKVIALGLTRDADDFTDDLRRGSEGDVGKRLRALVDESLDFAALRGAKRPPQPDPPEKGSRRNTRSSGKLGREKEAERAENGRLGEAFAYEQLKASLPEFGPANWVSENRADYGLPASGQDDLGYDFWFHDAEGVLCGEKNTRCLIEVKSSVSDDPPAFSISANQWAVARECSRSKDSRYLVLWVGNVRDAPRVIDLVPDPYGLVERRLARLDPHDSWFFVSREETG